MNQNKYIVLKIRDLRLKKNLSQTKFAEEINIPQTTLNRMEKETTPVSLEVLNAIKQAYNIPISYFFGETSANSNNIPLLSTQAAAGYFLGVGDVIVEDYLSLPGIKADNHIAISVRGSSMHPTITEGDVLVCRKIISMEEFVSGRVYVCLLASDTTTVKRVYIKNGIARLVSDNSVVEPLEIPQNELSQLWSVRYRITDHLRPENIEELYPVQ